MVKSSCTTQTIFQPIPVPATAASQITQETPKQIKERFTPQTLDLIQIKERVPVQTKYGRDSQDSPDF